MPTALQEQEIPNIVIKPGEDSVDHSQNTRREIAASVEEISGEKTHPSELIPHLQRSPMSEENILGEIKPDTSLKQKIVGQTEGSEPSKYLRWLNLGRIIKMNPGMLVKPEEE